MNSFLDIKDHYKHKKLKIKQLMMKNHNKKGIITAMVIKKDAIKNTKNQEKFKTPMTRRQKIRNKNTRQLRSL